MKKFLGILAIAGTLVACGNSGEGESQNTDTSTIIRQDTMGVITDTTINRDTIGQGVGNNPVSADTTQR
jgi:hypothetical protein